MHVSCNLCGSNDSEYLYDIAGYSIVRCKKCDLIYVNPQPTSKELEEFYLREFHSEEWYKKFPQLRDFRYFQKTTKDIEGFKNYLYEVKKYKVSGKLLDVGCGDGWLLKHALDFGFEVWGVEPTLKAFEEAVKKIGQNVFNTTLEDAHFADNYFDVVMSIGTIEHVKYPLSLLKEMNRILKQNGLLVIQTPNIKSYLAKKQGIRWEQFTVPGHLYFFSPKTLKMLLERSGFKVLKFDMRIPFFAPLDYGTLIKSSDSKGESDKQVIERSNKMRDSIFKSLRPFKPVLIPIYDILCQLKGRIIGKHDITVYARKV